MVEEQLEQTQFEDEEHGELMEVMSFEDLMKPQQEPIVDEIPKVETPAQETTQEAAQLPTQEEQVSQITEELPKVEFAPAPQKEFTPEELVSRFEDKKALLKALGLNDYLIGAVDYYKQTGDMTPYLEVKSVDYSKLSDAEIMRRNLREEVAGMNISDAQFELLYESRVAKKYKQDDPDVYSESELQLGKLEMQLDADKVRKTFMERQQKFAPPPQERQPEPEPERMEDIVNANKQRVLADQLVSQFVKNPILTIGKDETAFKYESKNSNALLGAIVDPNQTAFYTSKKNEYGQIMVDANNNPIPDYEFLLELAAHMTDRANYNSLLVKHGKSLGLKTVSEQINPVVSVTESNIPPAQETDNELMMLAAALKAQGY